MVMTLPGWPDAGEKEIGEPRATTGRKSNSIPAVIRREIPHLLVLANGPSQLNITIAHKTAQSGNLQLTRYCMRLGEFAPVNSQARLAQHFHLRPHPVDGDERVVRAVRDQKALLPGLGRQFAHQTFGIKKKTAHDHTAKQKERK